MKRCFEIIMYAPLGKRYGKMFFTEKGREINGMLELLGSFNEFAGSISDNGNIEITGKLNSGFAPVDFTAKGIINGGKISLDVKGGRYSFKITGEEIALEGT